MDNIQSKLGMMVSVSPDAKGFTQALAQAEEALKNGEKVTSIVSMMRLKV